MRTRAFTLVEVLVVIAIIAILSALLISVFVGVRRRALATQDISNLRQLGAAGSLYAADHNGIYPLPVAQLLSAGYGAANIASSPADTTDSGRAKLLRDELAVPMPRELGEEIKITYIGPGDGNWTWAAYQRKIGERPNSGWLINPVRLDLDDGKIDFPASGRYQRLTFGGAVINRHISWAAGRMMKFEWYFADYE